MHSSCIVKMNNDIVTSRGILKGYPQHYDTNTIKTLWLQQRLYCFYKWFRAVAYNQTHSHTVLSCIYLIVFIFKKSKLCNKHVGWLLNLFLSSTLQFKSRIFLVLILKKFVSLYHHTPFTDHQVALKLLSS